MPDVQDIIEKHDGEIKDLQVHELQERALNIFKLRRNLFKFNQGSTVIETRAIGTAFILGHASNAILGTSQLGVGTMGSWTVTRILNPASTHTEYFKTTQFKDTGNTTASWDTTNLQLSFTGSQTAQSKIIFKNNVNILKGTLIANEIITGTVAHYKFENGTGSTAYDSEGSNDGTITGATWIEGKIGLHSLNFNVAENYVEIPNIQGNFTTNYTPMTIAFWARSTGDETDRVFIDTSYDAGADDKKGFMIFTSSSNDIKLGYGNGTWTELDTLTDVIPNAWKYYVYVIEGDLDYRFYEDGVLKKSGTLVSDILFDDDSTKMWIGVRGNGWGDYAGRMEDVRVFNRALTANEVTSLYNFGIGREMTKVPVNTERLTYYLSADNGSHFEEVTNNTEHTFTNVSQNLIWKIASSDNAVINNLQVKYVIQA